MTVEGRFNAGRFIEFLERLIYSVENPIYLIVEGQPTHRASKVKKFVESTNGMLKLFYLPSYAPELNPDELVWNHVKHHRIGRSVISGPDQLKHKVIGFLRSLQKMPNLVRNFFHAPSVRYGSSPDFPVKVKARS